MNGQSYAKVSLLNSSSTQLYTFVGCQKIYEMTTERCGLVVRRLFFVTPKVKFDLHLDV
uniref:Uncharacterized protein n=1 Tax=Rhizophora mucronata TaxID=61149 RepID=A0A2P2QYG2_RHIMU